MGDPDLPFNKRLQDWLNLLGMRNATLARALGVSQPTVHGWLSGNESPRIDRLPSIASALGLSLSEFFGPLPERLVVPSEDVAELPPHPFTHEHTGEHDMRAFERNPLNADGSCPNCGHRGEAA